ncbi:hypothetical protein MAAFP003_579, partial [Mycobacterium ahvazicum]
VDRRPFAIGDDADVARRAGLQLVSGLLHRHRGANKVSRPAEQLYAVVDEAMQVLEHAELVRVTQR